MRSLDGMQIISNSGHTAMIHGAPSISGPQLFVQWTYRDSLMMSTMPADTTPEQVVDILRSYMVEMDMEVDG